ncbi:MAG: hypothetical protein AB1631_08525 [Acidobacteriota bacterium]
MQFAQIRDRAEIKSHDARNIDPAGLVGMWVNSNPDTRGVARMIITESGGKLSLRVQAIGPDGLIDWGSTDIALFASSPSSRAAAGFMCLYDFGFAETRLEAMILKGLIVLAQIHTFRDGRVDYFVREYFALDHGRY